MRKVFQYRIYPNKTQNIDMCNILEDCRWLYNLFLGERKNYYERENGFIGLYDQLRSIVDIKKYVNFTAYAQTLQNVGVRVDLAYQAFFRRCKNGERPGYPRFKSFGRYDSFTYPQRGFSINKNSIYLSKIGIIKAKFHRPIRGNIKTVTVKRHHTGKWFISISCDNVINICNKKPVGFIGIDIGLSSFATFSNGEKTNSPKFFKRSETILAKAQKCLSKTSKGSIERRRKHLIVSRIHEKIADQRKDFVYKLANSIAKKYKIICIEDLSINRMKENHKFSKSIHDAAWALFFQVLIHKAEEAGGKVVPVNPAYTSQDCSKCGTRVLKTLDERIHRCSVCGLVLDRDHNAAINILALGQQDLVNS